MVAREADNGTVMPDDVKARRQEIRDLAGVKVTAIEATTTTEELAAYITSAEYSRWEPAPPVEEPSA